ncbi:MAG: TDP-N-acetylfucosamine:lipid II N-acetylfucosaminyltransferase [Bacteroidales bacterium]|nr:TDP-N-acetylfucosamine:lipid II N-acetylfucosaminyltransferase [Bacteroidales bacterium]
MRLHILPDEKIINRTIKMFEEVYLGGNKYIILLRGDSTTGKYVQKCSEQVFFLKYDSDTFWSTVGDIKNYESVIIHYLSDYSADFINHIKHPKIYWIEWGGDLYNTFLEYKGFKLYEDEKLINQVSHGHIPSCLFKYYKNYQRRKSLKILYPAVKKVKYFVPDSMYDEYPLFKAYYPEFSHLEYREFFYYPIDEILGADLLDKTCEGHAIMVGNSCSFTSNHLSILQKLKDLEVDNKIIVPLSYAGNEEYKKLIINFGQDNFGNKFKPVVDYMPLDEYNKMLLSAGVFIYGSLRQEAVGNILIALYLGGKVFLDNRNPLLKFYKSLGLTIFSMDELFDENLKVFLSVEDIIKNKRILMKKYSLSRLLNLLRENF